MLARMALAVLAIIAVLLPQSGRAEQPAPGLGPYEARTIVTGVDMRMRPTGFAITFVDVLVKASGDPTLADDPRVEALAAEADKFVAGFDYRDRQSHLPFRDQQGSYDRPYNLTVRFDPARIDALLRDLGRTPWTGPRPAVVVLIRVEGARSKYRLTADVPEGAAQREALQAAAERYGLTITLAGDAWPPAEKDVLAVEGDLVWTEAAGGWVAEWRGRGKTWGARGVSFDEAFRALARGALDAAREKN